MRGEVILSHGSDSGPDATKVSALAAVAERLGWRTQRPDYHADDARGHAASVQPRVARLITAARDAQRPLVLVGSSMGAFVSGLASLQVPCAALFLLALPTSIPGFAQPFDMARGVPAMLIHGYQDQLCPAAAALAFARGCGVPALLLADDHRLSGHVEMIATQFGLFLDQCAA